MTGKDDSKMGDFTEKRKEWTNAALVEFSDLRSEQVSMQSRQTSIMSLSCTGISAFLGFALSIQQGTPASLMYAFVFVCIIPAIAMLAGLAYVDCVYRQSSICEYLFFAEERINSYLKASKNMIVGWEHYVKDKNPTKAWLAINRWQYMLALAYFLLIPIAPPMIYRFVLNMEWFKWLNFMGIAYIVYCILVLVYVGVILKVRAYSKTNGKKNS